MIRTNDDQVIAMMHVTIELPEEIAEELRARNGAGLPRAILEMVALEGYRSETLTHAQVGRLLGMEHPLRVEAFLKEHGVPLDYTREDLEQDRETHRRLGLLLVWSATPLRPPGPSAACRPLPGV